LILRYIGFMDEVEEVKSKIDIVDLIGGYLTLKKAGVNYKALCPFHSEKTPSFMVSPERQSFKCFGCSKGGDVYTFIEEIEGMEFYDALKLLAGRAGVELKPRRSIHYGEKEYQPSEKTKLFEINNLAARLYHKILTDHPKTQHARKYLVNRGLKKESIVNFQLGYAPRSWDLLLRFLKNKGYIEKEISRAGLLVLGEKGRYYDRFRGRIMFPINNIAGQVIAFTGRTLEDDLPAGRQVQTPAKYINSAESPIYTKGKTIYALDRARIEIRAQGFSVMVEGNMDVIACHPAGFRNVVAVSGTALTPDQLKILARYSPDTIFAFDSDSAGKAALKRAITLAVQSDLNAKVITLPGFKDPDEAIKSDPKNWQQGIKTAKPALEYWIDCLVLEQGITDVGEKKKISKEILPVIKIISNDLEKEHYLKYLAKKLAISESAVTAQLSKAKVTQEREVSAQAKVGLDYEQRVAGLVWQEKKLIDKIPTAFFGLNFQDQAVRALFEKVKHNQELKKLPAEIKSKLDLYALEAMRDLDLDEEGMIEREFEYLVRDFFERKKERTKAEFAEKIAEAETAGDRDKIKELMSQFQSAIIDGEK